MASDPVTDNVLLLEAPLRALATRLARDEVEAILREALDDVYEDESDD